MEKTVGKTAPDADGVTNDVVADIALDLGPKVFIIDFAVGSPDASSSTWNIPLSLQLIITEPQNT